MQTQQVNIQDHDAIPLGRKPSPHDNPTQLPTIPPFGDLLRTLGKEDFPVDDQAPSGDGKKWESRVAHTLRIPRKWTPLKESDRLEEDRGDYFRDPNAARFPKSPLEPAVQALLVEDKAIETQKIDLFACSSTLGNLLRFVQGVGRPFRFFVELVGSTVFFTRHENSPTQLIEGIKGYGHSFSEANTTWDADVEGSMSHQRLLRYNLAGLECVLRFECDGYLASKLHGGSEASVHSLQKGSEMEDRAAEFREGDLIMRKAGRKIPQEAVFDLKTRGGWRKEVNVLKEEAGRYWITQVPNLILARHNYGIFDDVTVHNIRKDVEAWQETNQTQIKRLVWLLREIIRAAKLREDGKLEVCATGPITLEQRTQVADDQNVMSPELKCRWIDKTLL